MDVLTDVLRTAGMTVRVDEVIVHKAAWRIETKPATQIVFYAIANGDCFLTANGETSQLTMGDVVFVNQHVFYSLNGKASTTLVTGAVSYSAGFPGMQFFGLPPALILKPVAAIETIFRRFIEESIAADPGWRVVSEALALPLFVQALREHGKSNCDGTHGWLRGLADSEIGAALQLMHQRPADRWTVAKLAEALSISRSAFAARFKEVTGRPPLDYLTWWRLHRAAARLRRQDGATIAMVAREAGYDSDASFGKAFRREFGKPPGDIRREAASRASSPLQFELKKQKPFEVPEQEAGLNLFKTTAHFQIEYQHLFAEHGLESSSYNVLRILRGIGAPVSRDEVLARLVVPNSDPQRLFSALIKSRLIKSDNAKDECSVTLRGQGNRI